MRRNNKLEIYIVIQAQLPFVIVFLFNIVNQLLGVSLNNSQTVVQTQTIRNTKLFF